MCIIIQIMNVYECDGMSYVMSWRMDVLFNRGEAKLNGTLNLSTNILFILSHE